ncbi:MAG: nicotinamide phosphoribosyltransferase [Parcubacteria group bacterium Gr01-1014_70]|nr:MAG: nicotinamide phosphoribosyltransferase [Parcubacteria group bacterium Gr01-1014_70]
MFDNIICMTDSYKVAHWKQYQPGTEYIYSYLEPRSGGGLLQSCDRDTQNFVLKCSHTTVNGDGYDVFKRPVTDPMKNSKRGRLKLIKTECGTYATVPASAPGKDELVPVFRDGQILTSNMVEDMRARAELTS